jgi:hypothetical protein
MTLARYETYLNAEPTDQAITAILATSLGDVCSDNEPIWVLLEELCRAVECSLDFTRVD